MFKPKVEIDQELGYALIRNGYYYKQPKYRRVYLDVISWIKGTVHFLNCLGDYDKTIKGNDLDLKSAWELSHSLQEMRIGKSSQMVFLDDITISKEAQDKLDEYLVIYQNVLESLASFNAIKNGRDKGNVEDVEMAKWIIKKIYG